MPQTANVDGRNNIIVQIVGDGNTVVPSYAHLTLLRYLTRRQMVKEVYFLSPYTKTTQLIGREADLAALQAWLGSPALISVRVLIGRAGSGKTRLALDLCDTVSKEGEMRCWDAGFVTGPELERFRQQQNLASWGWQRPTLIVIDYAASKTRALRHWLQELADYAGEPGGPLRLLLLERHADTNGGWWQEAFGRGGWTAEAVARLLDPPQPIALPRLAEASCNIKSSTRRWPQSARRSDRRIRAQIPTSPVVSAS
jgi:hypothetical protein